LIFWERLVLDEDSRKKQMGLGRRRRRTKDKGYPRYGLEVLALERGKEVDYVYHQGRTGNHVDFVWGVFAFV
jgi:hypothetical protein